MSGTFAAVLASWLAVAVAGAGPTVDHGDLTTVLEKHVREGGWVDYGALAGDHDLLDRYVASLAAVPFEELGRDEQLALLINAYNAFTLRLILDFWDGGTLESIRDIPKARRWKDRRWRIGDPTWSLDEIEHQQIRPVFEEPRIHFALVCAAVSCPPLRREAYEAGRLEEQLEDQARYVHRHPAWFRFDPERRVAHLTQLYGWFGDDFEMVADSALDFAARYSADLAQALEAGEPPEVRWLDYSWEPGSGVGQLFRPRLKQS